MYRLSKFVIPFVVATTFAASSWAATVFNVAAFAPDDPDTDAAAQQAYLDAVDAAGYAALFEGFTDAPWDAARSTVVGGQHVATSITNQGITWHSSVGDFITTSDASSGVTPWHIYSKGGSPQEQLHAVPATIIGESAQPLYGIGMWVSGGPPAKGKLHLIIDDATTFKFERITGYQNGDPQEPIKETIRLQSGKQFFGVIVPAGFTKFQLLETEGVLEDQVLMWGADFTFAATPVPEPDASVLLAAAMAIVLAGFLLRRNQSAAGRI